MGESDSCGFQPKGVWDKLTDWEKSSVLKFFYNLRISWHIFSLDSDAREPSIKKLAEIGEPAVPALINALRNKDQLVRCGAIEALGNIADSGAIPVLIDVLKDDNEYVRSNAVEALGKIEDSRAVPVLITSLKDKHGEVRRRAAYALGKFAEKRHDVSAAVPSLIDALKNDNSNVQACAASALGHIGDTSAVPPLIDVLTDKEWDVRFSAAGALGIIVAELSDKGEYFTVLEIIKDSTQAIMKSSDKKKDRYSLKERRGRLRILAEFTQKIHDKMNPLDKKEPMKFSGAVPPKKPHPARRKMAAIYR